MAKKGSFAEQIEERRRLAQQATRETYTQYLTDTLIMTLNDPEVMGKDVFGEARIRKILAAWGKKYDEYFDALTKSAEADYYREKMDAHIKAICKSGDFVPFEKRYDWLPEITYAISR